jgi:hypothetical protein
MFLQWAMGGSTLNLPHSSTPPLYHLYITSSPPTPNHRRNPPITIAWVHVTSSHSPLYVLTYFETYWQHSQHPTDWGLRRRRKPQQTLSQEKKADYIHSQRARKRRRKEEPWPKYSNSPKKANNILLNIYIHHSTNPNPLEWTSLNHKSIYVQVTLRHPQTYIRIDLM